MRDEISGGFSARSASAGGRRSAAWLLAVFAALLAAPTAEAQTNNAPEFSAETATRSFDETFGNATVSTASDIGDPVTATDDDDDDLTYTLEGTDAAKFTINSGTGQIQTKVGQRYNRELNSSFSVRVKADDGNGGNDTIDVTLNVNDLDEPPLRPRAPTLSASSATEMSVTWIFPNNNGRPGLQDVYVRYQKNGDSENWRSRNFAPAGSGGSGTIRNLEVAVDYEFQVRLENTEGESPWSDSAIGSTVSRAPPVRPAAPTVTAASGSATSLDVSWTAPDNGSRPAIASYDLRYREGSSGGWTNGPQDVTTTSSTITNLTENASHQVQVRATNTNGNSDWSPWGTGSTTNAPEFSAETATRSFNETIGSDVVSTASDIGDEVTATDDDNDPLMYTLEGTDAAKFDIVTGTGQIRTKVGEKYDYESSTSFSVTVKADDGNGGDDTIDVTLNVNDQAERPLKSGVPSWTAISPTAIRIDWGFPDNRGRPAISSYDLRYRKDGTSDAWTTQSSAAPQGGIPGGSIEATGLEVAVDYEFQIRFANDDGDGPWSDSRVASTASQAPPATPAAPTVTATSGSTTSLDVSWTAPDNGSRPAIASYDLQYRVGSSGGWTDGPQDLTATSSAITNLAEGTSYEVQVRATNTNGDGAWSPSGTGSTDRNNIAPAFSDATATRSFDETIGNDAVLAASDIGAAVTATDDDGDNLTYTLEGTDAAKFDIVPGTGQIRTKVGEIYDHESSTSYSVTVKADDSNGGDDTIDVTLNVNDLNEPPAGPVAPVVIATSESTSSLDVSWSAPDNTGRPAIASYDLQYRVGSSGGWTNGPQDVSATDAAIPSLAASTSYEVQVRATNTDGDGPWSPSGTGSTGTPDNNAPAFSTATATRSFDETIGGNTVSTASNIGAAVTAIDQDNDNLTYTVEGADAAKFTINSGTGQIRTRGGESYSYESNASYSVTVKADDGKGGADVIAVTLNVNDLNEPPLEPAAPTLSPTSFTEILVSWTAPNNTGRPAISSYDLRYRVGSGGGWTNGPQGVSTTSSAITGLTEGASYEVQVRAANNEGDGPWSASGTGSTGSAGNIPATGSPTLSGPAQVGMTLTASTSDIEDADGLTNPAYVYEWLRAGTPIPGAASSTYTTTSSDQNLKLEVRVTFTDDATNTETLTSDETYEVAPAAAACPESVWCTTLTVGRLEEDSGGIVTVTETGFRDIPGVAAYGSLSLATFTHLGVDYTVTSLYGGGAQNLYFSTTPNLPSGGAELTLHVQKYSGEIDLPLGEATFSADTWQWAGGQLYVGETGALSDVRLLRGAMDRTARVVEPTDIGTEVTVRLHGTRPVSTESEEIPTELMLMGNYPNPFNPQTTIDYALAQAGPVRLVVYDMTGRTVTVLVDGVQPQGRHTARFHAGGLPTGTYVYRLSAEAETLTRTMTLIR